MNIKNPDFITGTEQDFSQVMVLIVEDNKISQLLVKNMLKKFGFSNFHCAENGNTALTRISENKYDIILMDIQMPGMDGFEITNVIRTKMRESICHIPIIALTADASAKEKEKARKAGMNEYVVKPYTPEALYSTMLKCLNMKEQPADPSRKKRPAVHKEDATEAKRYRAMELGFLEKFTGGDAGITFQLIELFLSDVPEALRKLKILIPLASWKEVHHVSHKVKSCMAVFGLNELKEIIVSIEEYSRDLTHVEDIPKLFSKFNKGCKEAVLDLEAELRRLKEPKA